MRPHVPTFLPAVRCWLPALSFLSSLHGGRKTHTFARRENSSAFPRNLSRLLLHASIPDRFILRPLRRRDIKVPGSFFSTALGPSPLPRDLASNRTLHYRIHSFDYVRYSLRELLRERNRPLRETLLVSPVRAPSAESPTATFYALLHHPPSSPGRLGGEAQDLKRVGLGPMQTSPAVASHHAWAKPLIVTLSRGFPCVTPKKEALRNGTLSLRGAEATLDGAPMPRPMDELFMPCRKRVQTKRGATSPRVGAGARQPTITTLGPSLRGSWPSIELSLSFACHHHATGMCLAMIHSRCSSPPWSSRTPSPCHVSEAQLKRLSIPPSLSPPFLNPLSFTGSRILSP